MGILSVIKLHPGARATNAEVAFRLLDLLPATYIGGALASRCPVGPAAITVATPEDFRRQAERSLPVPRRPSGEHRGRACGPLPPAGRPIASRLLDDRAASTATFTRWSPLATAPSALLSPGAQTSARSSPAGKIDSLHLCEKQVILIGARRQQNSFLSSYICRMSVSMRSMRKQNMRQVFS